MNNPSGTDSRTTFQMRPYQEVPNATIDYPRDSLKSLHKSHPSRDTPQWLTHVLAHEDSVVTCFPAAQNPSVDKLFTAPAVPSKQKQCIWGGRKWGSTKKKNPHSKPSSIWSSYIQLHFFKMLLKNIHLNIPQIMMCRTTSITSTPPKIPSFLTLSFYQSSKNYPLFTYIHLDKILEVGGKLRPLHFNFVQTERR